MAEVDAARARALVGVPFRAQGRDPARGLDCAGLVITACGPNRNQVAETIGCAEIIARNSSARCRLIPKDKQTNAPGDVMLMAVASDQLHLAFVVARSVVRSCGRAPAAGGRDAG